MNNYVRHNDNFTVLESLRGNRAPCSNCLINNTGERNASLLKIVEVESVQKNPVYEVDSDGNTLTDKDGQAVQAKDAEGALRFNSVSSWHKEVRVDQGAKDAHEAQKAEEQASKDAVKYKEDRRNKYPSVGDQLDALYKLHSLGDETEYERITEEIKAVKTKYPKPE